jgi:hypothetical protein
MAPRAMMSGAGQPAAPMPMTMPTPMSAGSGGAAGTTPITATGGTMAMMPNTMPGAPTMSGGILPKVDTTDGDGPLAAMGMDHGEFYVYRPMELGKDGLKHPIFVWGTGAGSVPSEYTFFAQFATHGIVVVSPDLAQKGAADMKAALDWIIAQNEDSSSPYYQKLDTTRVGMGGHSQGSVATFDQEGMEDRLKTTIHIAGGSFDMRGSSKVKTPTAYICGETDFALPNCEADWETVEDQPTFFSVLMGVDHVTCARRAMAGMVAWLRWHLGDESERAAEFTGPGGKFHMDIWVSQTKNWNF